MLEPDALGLRVGSPCTDCVILGESLNLSEPRLPQQGIE